MAKPPEKTEIGWEPLVDLLQAFHPENPIVHTIEGDVKSLAISLLEGGWVEPVTRNKRNGLLVGGHGRVMAAQWLTQQSQNWFDHYWALWDAAHDSKGDESDRFNPEYWEQCLVLVVDLSETEHDAMLIRLNDTESQGKDDPERLKKILSGLSARLQSLAGHAPPADAPILSDLPESDVERKQVFERPDATDYSVRDEPMAPNAIAQSGEVATSYQPPQPPSTLDDDEDAEFEDAGIESDDDDDDTLPEALERPEKPPKEPTAPAPPPLVLALPLTVTWAQWRKWNEWKRQNGITKDTDAFWKGHDAFITPPPASESEDAVDEQG